MHGETGSLPVSGSSFEETMRVCEAQIAIVDSKVKKTQINQDVTLYKGEIPQEFQEK